MKLQQNHFRTFSQKLAIVALFSAFFTLFSCESAFHQPDPVGQATENADKKEAFSMSRADNSILRDRMKKSIPGDPESAEQYDKIVESDFKKAADEPVSTFSIDVDPASYANVRRFLNAGQMPPADAVRVEEMINYFDYQYKTPAGNAPTRRKDAAPTPVDFDCPPSSDESH